MVVGSRPVAVTKTFSLLSTQMTTTRRARYEVFVKPLFYLSLPLAFAGSSRLRYFNLEPSFKLLRCRARDLFRSQIPVTTGGFELPFSCIRSS